MSPVNDPQDYEREVARDLARRALIVAPVVVLGAGLWSGWGGAAGAALGMAVVAANFWMLAKLMAVGAKAGGTAVAFGALLGYALLLIFITLFAVLLRSVSFVDLPSFVVTIAFAHLGLIFAEMPRVGLTLGAPGLKPRPPPRAERRDRVPADGEAEAR